MSEQEHRMVAAQPYRCSCGAAFQALSEFQCHHYSVAPSPSARQGEAADTSEGDVPAWLQIRAGSELDELVRLVRFAPGQATGFLHSEHDAAKLLWRWALKWFVVPSADTSGLAARLTEQIANFTQRNDGVKLSPNVLAFIDDAVLAALRSTPPAPPAPEIAQLVKQYESALESIAANSCCDRCREAALVAAAALASRPADEQEK